MIISSSPPAHRGDTNGDSKVPLRSRGPSKATLPDSAATVVSVAPSREFGLQRPGRVAHVIAEMVRQLGGQAAFQDGLDHLRQEAPPFSQLGCVNLIRPRGDGLIWPHPSVGVEVSSASAYALGGGVFRDGGSAASVGGLSAGG